MSNLPTGMDSSTNSTQIDYSKLPRKRDPKTGTILFQFDTPNGKKWLTSAPDTTVENVRDLTQILAHFDSKVMGHEGEFNYSTGRMSYPAGSPTEAEIKIVRKATPDQLVAAIETVRTQMWSRVHGMDSQKMYDLQSWIVNIKVDKETKDRLLLQQRQKEAESAQTAFVRQSMKNTYVCPKCDRLIARETVHKYTNCPGCNEVITE